MKETIKKLREQLEPLYGKRESEAIIRLIFRHLKGWNLTDMLIHQEDELSVFVKEEIDQILERLLKYESIQYITGEARFHGMDLKIKPGVLIPRPETDELVDLIIDSYKNKEDLEVLDLCTGSGCIAIALARNLPFSKVTALDFSDDAIETAQLNANLLKTKIKLVKDNIFTWLPDHKFDLIVSNPPYIMDKETMSMEKNVLDYEPHEALFVRDDNPLEFYVRIIEIADVGLKDKGEIFLEINPLNAERLKSFLISRGLEEVTVIKDSYGKDRFIKATKV